MLDLGSFVFEDEGDVFQCGRCKRQFSSLTVFMHHKREECTTVLMSTYGKRVDTRGKTLQDELSKTHFICSSSGHSMTEEVPVNSYEGNSVSELSTAEQIHHQQHSHTEENIISGATPVIHFTPSIVLGEETVSFTIPVDQNSSIAHLVGNNSPQVCQQRLLFYVFLKNSYQTLLLTYRYYQYRRVNWQR